MVRKGVPPGAETEAVASEHLQERRETVSFLVGQIKTLSSKLRGDEKQQRFSPTTLKVAMALYLRSPKAYEEAGRVSPLPSVSTILKRKQAMRCEDGVSAKLFIMARDRNQGRACLGLVVVDEMKIEDGILFNSSNHSIAGFTEEALDLETLTTEMIHRKVDVPGPPAATTTTTNIPSAATANALAGSAATNGASSLVHYVNQFMFRSAEAGGPTFPVSYFFDKSPVSGAVMMQQLVSVIRGCELCSFHIHGICCDAGGGNASLFALARAAGPTKRSDEALLPDDFVSMMHPLFPNQRIWLFHCATHGK